MVTHVVLLFDEWDKEKHRAILRGSWRGARGLRSAKLRAQGRDFTTLAHGANAKHLEKGALFPDRRVDL